MTTKVHLNHSAGIFHGSDPFPSGPSDPSPVNIYVARCQPALNVGTLYVTVIVCCKRLYIRESCQKKH